MNIQKKAQARISTALIFGQVKVKFIFTTGSHINPEIRPRLGLLNSVSIIKVYEIDGLSAFIFRLIAYNR